MNSVSPGRTSCSSHNEGFTPVSQRSNASSFASSQLGLKICTSRLNSSKQNKKKRCGYQCRQKCQNRAEKVRQSFLPVFFSTSNFSVFPSAATAWVRHKPKMIAATSACVPISLAGCARFSANSAISTLDSPRYPSATHSNVPHSAHAVVISCASCVAILSCPVCGVSAITPSLL